MDQFIAISFGVLITALVTGAGAWIVFGSRFSTKADVSRKMENVGTRIHEWGLVVAELEKKNARYMDRDQIAELITKNAPWIRDKSRIEDRVGRNSERIDKLEDLFRHVKESMDRMEGMLAAALGLDGKKR